MGKYIFVLGLVTSSYLKCEYCGGLRDNQYPITLIIAAAADKCQFSAVMSETYYILKVTLIACRIERTAERIIKDVFILKEAARLGGFPF